MIGFLTKLALFIVIFNIFLYIITENSGEMLNTVNTTDIQRQLNETQIYSSMQPLAYFTWLTIVKAWNILSEVLRSIFMTGTLLRTLLPLIPPQIEWGLNTTMSILIVVGLIEFLRGMRL